MSLFVQDAFAVEVPDKITLFLCGDVMTGRGIDQVLPSPGKPKLHEHWATSAEDYVHLAETANGPIPAPVPPDYIWGDALKELERVLPTARIINLETSITTSDRPEPKGINYRMNPGNIGCLTAAQIDCCVLANNHVLDWRRKGLTETLGSLDQAGLGHAGAGSDRVTAEKPWIGSLPGGGRLLVFGYGHETSGIPVSWVATPEAAGINLLPDLSDETASQVIRHIDGWRQPGDLVVFSVHWGGNWGYSIPETQRAFAHALIDAGAVDIVHGHSSHHPKAMEIYRGKPVIYGCGDFINDYEGIRGKEEYRGDLSVMYLPSFSLPDYKLAAFRLVPFQMHRFRLRRVSKADHAWLLNRLNSERRGLPGQLRKGSSLDYLFE